MLSTARHRHIVLSLPGQVLEEVVVPLDIREHYRVCACPEQFCDIRTEGKF